MRLTYRGASYESNTQPLEVRETDIIRYHRDAQQRCQTLRENNYPLTYRGVQYTTQQIATALATSTYQKPQTLSYRGAKYVRDVDGAIHLASPLQNVVIPNTTAPMYKEVFRVHKENIRRNLERRLNAAKARDDQALVRMLEAEYKQLAL